MRRGDSCRALACFRFYMRGRNADTSLVKLDLIT